MAGDDLLPVSPLVITEKRGRIGYYFLLPVFILFLSSAGLAVFFLLWFTVIRGVQPGADQSQTAFILQNGAFLVDEGTSLTKSGEPKARLLGLTISTLTVCMNSLCYPEHIDNKPDANRRHIHPHPCRHNGVSHRWRLVV